MIEYLLILISIQLVDLDKFLIEKVVDLDNTKLFYVF